MAAIDCPEGVLIDDEDGEALPLIIRPKGEQNSVEYLKNWITGNKEWLDAKLLQHGALLLKGFEVDNGAEFQDVILHYTPELCDEYRGTSPRTLIPGTKYVFTASDIPSSVPIPQHLEMSFLPAPPRQLYFCCLDPPTSRGGETCLCDYKEVYKQLDPEIRKEFEEKGILHIRNYTRVKGYFSDPSMMKAWPDVFGMDSREEVTQELKEQGLDHSWKKNDDLQILNPVAAIEKHPITKESIWFNHLMVFHWSLFYQENYHVWKRLGQLKFLLMSILMWLLSFLFLTWRGVDKVGMHTLYGDGSTIPEKTIAYVRDTVWKNMVFNRWEKGDILIIDNFRVSHGRQPYSGKRKIVVSWAPPMKRPSQEVITTES